MNLQRLEKLRATMRSANIDTLALIPGANMRWLGGGVHYIGERPIILFIPLADEPLAIIPQLEVPLFSALLNAPRIVSWTDAEGYEEAFRTGLAMLPGKNIGVEGLHMRFFEAELIRRHAPGATVAAADDLFSSLRLHKDESEIAALRQAIAISEKALQLTLAAIRPGMSEIQLAQILDAHMSELGSEEPAFKTILHGGANTALPHTGPLPYRVQSGDPILIDFGATYEGYRADITRVVFLGQPTQEQIDFYTVVQKANAAAHAASRPGVTAESVDQAARQVIIDAGYAHLLRHRTGHGLGLETHEGPYIVGGNKTILQPGMVFTAEPGIYEMGRIGVRIEDDILITSSGSESLTNFSRDIIVV